MPLQTGVDSGHAGTRRVAVEQRWGSVTIAPPTSRSARVILSAPSAGLTFRALSLPFADRRRLEPMVAQELEHSLGFPPGQAAWDFVARPPRDGAENVFVVACPRSSVESVLASVPDERPAVVDAEPYAYQRVLALAGIQDGLVADFGASHTTFCRIRGGHLDYVRVLMRGGDDLDASIARRQGSRSEAAQALKHEKGLALPEVREFLDRMVSDALLPPEPADAPLFVTGGGARIRGLEDWLSKLGHPVRTLPVPDGVDPYTDVVAFGMALWDGRGSEGVNLYVVKETRSYAGVIALFMALILLTVSVDVAAREMVLKREYDRNVDAIRRIARAAVPGGNVNTLSQLQSVLQDRSAGTTAVGRNAQAVMLTLSQAVQEAHTSAKSTELKLVEIVIGASELRLRGEAVGYPLVEALKTALASRFASVDVSSDQLPGTADRWSFTMVAPLGGAQ